jgi:glycine hydroxymethyltransferase
MAAVLRACVPFVYAAGRGKPLHRARVDFKALNDSKNALRDLALRMGIDYQASAHGYPHFYYSDSAPQPLPFTTLLVSGEHAAHFLELALSSSVGALAAKGAQATSVARLEHGTFITVAGTVERATTVGSFELVVPSADASAVAAWLRDVSDGYVSIDAADVHGKLPGPVQVEVTGGRKQLPAAGAAAAAGSKPYYIGQAAAAPQGAALPEFVWNEAATAALQHTPLHAQHLALRGRLAAFAGWEMPLWYSSVVEEHAAVRNAAGLFDVAHMGVWDASGSDAAGFLDQLVGNDVRALGVGESLYTHLLTPAADVIDDLLIYRLQAERFLVVVNAGNDSKDWAWVNAVQAGTVRVDAARPAAQLAGRAAVQLRDLRAVSSEADQRVDLALQGPASQQTLLALGGAAADVARVRALKRTQLCSATLGGFDLIVSRTGYSGELLGYELFVHPARAEALWLALLAAGAPLGVKPCGLAARDSLRTEAGLPLYGHEFAGALALGVGESGFGAYIKLHKPWFIGRAAFMQREQARTREVMRFRFAEKGVRMAHPGDPLVDKRGRVAGTVTSCALDSDGFLTGQAVVELALTEPGTAVGVFAGGGEKPELRAKLQPGERVPLCSWAVVQPRMWRKQTA